MTARDIERKIFLTNALDTSEEKVSSSIVSLFLKLTEQFRLTCFKYDNQIHNIA